ncbi:MAG TPA: hypothetical protein PLE60_08885 [Candidatus Latescibacteria bacterium]|nr:hypothetical protein [Candidatus Latescibacterota bacterium]
MFRNNAALKSPACYRTARWHALSCLCRLPAATAAAVLGNHVAFIPSRQFADIEGASHGVPLPLTHTTECPILNPQHAP